MKKLSTAFKIVGTLALIAALLCGAIFSGDANSGAFLVFVCWAVGGGLFFMFALAQALLLDAAADIKDRTNPSALAKELAWHLSRDQSDAPQNKAKPAQPQDGFVVCPNCGYEQPEHFATGDRRTTCCDCGAKLPMPGSNQANAGKIVKPIVYEWCEGFIVCPCCKQKQRDDNTVCSYCGAQFVTPEAEDQD